MRMCRVGNRGSGVRFLILCGIIFRFEQRGNICCEPYPRCMELMIIMTVAALAVYLLCVVSKNRRLFFVPVVLSIGALALTLTEPGLTDTELVVLIVLDVFLFLSSLVSQLFEEAV